MVDESFYENACNAGKIFSEVIVSRFLLMAKKDPKKLIDNIKNKDGYLDYYQKHYSLYVGGNYYLAVSFVGEALRREGHLEAALDLNDLALELAPEKYEPYYLRILLMLDLGEKEKARQALEKALLLSIGKKEQTEGIWSSLENIPAKQSR